MTHAGLRCAMFLFLAMDLARTNSMTAEVITTTRAITGVGTTPVEVASSTIDAVGNATSVNIATTTGAASNSTTATIHEVLDSAAFHLSKSFVETLSERCWCR